MNIKRGDIYWIEPNKYRPAVGSVQKPGRPGIVVSNDANNSRSNTVEIVYLTSQPKKDMPTHCTIESTGRVSTVLCEQVTTVSIEQLGGYIGQCTDEEMAEVDRCLTISLGLPDPMEDLLNATREAGTIQEIYNPAMHIHNLELDLAAANARAKLMKEMYFDLLERTMA